MSEKRHSFVSAVHLILERDGKVLLLRRQNTGFHDGFYSVVAGHIEAGEPAKLAMIREAKEEADIDIDVMHRKGEDNEKIDFFMRASGWRGEPRIGEPEKCDDLSWFALEGLPENMVPYIKAVLERIEQGDFYSEFGWQL